MYILIYHVYSKTKDQWVKKKPLLTNLEWETFIYPIVNKQRILSNSKYFELKILLSKSRMSKHSFLIENERYLKTPRENRVCVSCNKIEDENHFLLHCIKNKEHIRYYLEKVQTGNLLINLESWTENEEIRFILTRQHYGK